MESAGRTETRRWPARLAAGSLVVVVLSGCSGSDSTGSVSSDTVQETTIIADEVTTSDSLTLTLEVDRLTAELGQTIRVTGTGCIDPTGDGSRATAVVGIGVDPDRFNGRGDKTTEAIVAADGAFAATVPIDAHTPPGDQQLRAGCVVSKPAGRIDPSDSETFWHAVSPSIAIVITGATPLTVSPTRVNASQRVHVRGRCQDPGSTSEGFSAWITPAAPTVPAQPPGPGAESSDCRSATAGVDLSVRHQASIEADPTLPIIRITRDFDATPAESFESRGQWLASGMETGVDQGYAKLDAFVEELR